MGTVRVRWLAALAVAMLTVGATAARADDTYFGCSKNSNSKVRPSSILVNQTPACKPTETLRSWSQAGPPGITSCHPEEFPGTIPANTYGVINMFCASGHAVGAGGIWSSPFDGANNGKIYVFPRGDDFWTCLPYNDTPSASNIKCYMQCCD